MQGPRAAAIARGCVVVRAAGERAASPGMGASGGQYHRGFLEAISCFAAGCGVAGAVSRRQVGSPLPMLGPYWAIESRQDQFCAVFVWSPEEPVSELPVLGAGGHLPDIRRLDVACHAAIVWDECDPRQILNNKVVFQSGPLGVTLAQSACNAHAYVKFLHRVAHIVCANSFAREAGDTCADGTVLSEADADWLRSNVCFIDLAPLETLFLAEAGEDEAVAELDALYASSGGGPGAVSL